MKHIIAGIVGAVAFLMVVVVIAAQYTEINDSSYADVTNWSGYYPEVKRLTCIMLEDGKITGKEYAEIDRLHTQLFEQVFGKDWYEKYKSRKFKQELAVTCFEGKEGNK